LYDEASLRAFNILVETSLNKSPVTSLGTSRDILLQDTSGNGHVSRNIRVSLAAIDLVEPYVSIVGVANKTVVGDFAQLKKSTCKLLPTVSISKDSKTITIYWTVGGAISIDSTSIWIVDANKVSDTDLKNCSSQPEITTINNLFQMGKYFAGEGFFSVNGPRPSHKSAIGPRFSSTIPLPLDIDHFLVIASAKVDSSWATQPSNAAPDVPPQSHLANVRTNPSWKFSYSNQTIQGRLDWFSVPVRIKRRKTVRSTSPPISSATVRSASASSSCFPGNAQVMVKNRGLVKMSTLVVGDVIQVANEKFEAIYSFGHRNATVTADFVRIITNQTVQLSNALELSKDHMVVIESGLSVPASMIHVGDYLRSEKGTLVLVKAIRTISRQGVFAPFTSSGFLVVNGILVSNYVSYYNDSGHFKLGGMKTPITFQWAAHALNSLHRIAYRMGIKNETYQENGISNWVHLPHKYSNWLIHQNTIMSLSILLVLLLLLMCVVILEVLTDNPVYYMAPLILIAIVWSSPRNKVV
jgi:hypothetical protein